MPIATLLDVVLGNDPHDHHPAHHVKTVQSSSDVIEAPEVAGEKREAVLDFGGVLVGFETHEKSAEQNRQPNPHAGFLRVTLFRSGVSEYDEQAGGQEPEGIAGPDKGVRVGRFHRP